MEIVYRARSWIASAPTVLVVATALVLTTVSLPKPAKEPAKTPVKIQLTAMPEPPPPEPPPPQPAPPPPVPVPPPPAPAPPVPAPPVPLPPKPVTPPKPTARPKPADHAPPQPQSQPEAAAAAPSTAPATTASAATAAPAPAAPTRASSAEDAYVALVRADIEANKHYPTGKEARLARPHGDVEVWFRLDRSGAVKEAGVQTSSGSLILDQAALALVRGGNYPGFPSEIYQGSSEHRFVVTLSYSYS